MDGLFGILVGLFGILDGLFGVVKGEFKIFYFGWYIFGASGLEPR